VADVAVRTTVLGFLYRTQRLSTRLEIRPVEAFSMTSYTRPSRLAEWAELVGGSVPEAALDTDESAPLDRPTHDTA
jgi:hypothetical protein